jgi:hypothetical protein
METYQKWLQVEVNNEKSFYLCENPCLLQEEDVILIHHRKGIIHEIHDCAAIVYWLDTHEFAEENLRIKGIHVQSQSLLRKDIIRQWGNQLFHYVDGYKKNFVQMSINQQKFNQLFSQLYYSINK